MGPDTIRYNFAVPLTKGGYSARRCTQIIEDAILVANALPLYRRTGEFRSLINMGVTSIASRKRPHLIAARTLAQLYADLGGHGDDLPAKRRAAAVIGEILDRNQPGPAERACSSLLQRWSTTRRQNLGSSVHGNGKGDEERSSRSSYFPHGWRPERHKPVWVWPRS